MKKPMLMIVDDDEETRFLFKQLFRDEVDLRAFADTQSLMEALSIEQPDLLIMDHRIGDATSIELMELIHAQGFIENISVLLYSGDEDIVVLAEKINARGYIRKPSSIAQIRETVRFHLSGKAVNG